eukprot:GHVS01037468.1.p2 GENE.GHVS01037468.1~~GHVS01037468.1.p2  ORF type:complete len:119 (+),score=2.09 GHVS01037468.1:399-755(+)
MFALWMVLLFLILGAAPPTVSFKPEFMHIAVASEWYQKNIMLIFFTKNSFIKYLDRHKIKGHVQSCGVPIDSGKDSYLRFTSYLYYLKRRHSNTCRFHHCWIKLQQLRHAKMPVSWPL